VALLPLCRHPWVQPGRTGLNRLRLGLPQSQRRARVALRQRYLRIRVGRADICAGMAQVLEFRVQPIGQ